MPIPVATRSKAWSAAVTSYGLRVRIPPGVWMSDCCDYWCVVFVGLITRPEESY